MKKNKTLFQRSGCSCCTLRCSNGCPPSPPKADSADETGGKHKGFRQLEGIANGWVVSDDIEVGFGRKVPLWIFGFLY